MTNTAATDPADFLRSFAELLDTFRGTTAAIAKTFAAINYTLGGLGTIDGAPWVIYSGGKHPPRDPYFWPSMKYRAARRHAGYTRSGARR